jgi:hypothetical protein
MTSNMNSQMNTNGGLSNLMGNSTMASLMQTKNESNMPKYPANNSQQNQQNQFTQHNQFSQYNQNNSNSLHGQSKSNTSVNQTSLLGNASGLLGNPNNLGNILQLLQNSVQVRFDLCS